MQAMQQSSIYRECWLKVISQFIEHSPRYHQFLRAFVSLNFFLGLSSAAVSKPIFQNIPPPRITQTQDQLSQLSLDSNVASYTTAPITPTTDEGYSSEHEKINSKIASQSTISVNATDTVEKGIRMLAFLTTIIYGVGGLQQDKPFKADFNL